MTGYCRHAPWLFAVSVLALCLVTATLPGATTVAGHETHEESLRVELQADGDATVTLVVTEDITDEADREAFEQLNTTARAEQFEERMRQVAERTATEAERNMTVSSAKANVETTEDTGVVELSVTWSGLATVEDDRLVVTEPFASGFQPDRPLVLTAPEGYTISETAVSPAQNDGDVARWSDGANLTGFSTAATAEESGGDAVPTGLVPGLALLLASGLSARLYRRR